MKTYSVTMFDLETMEDFIYEVEAVDLLDAFTQARCDWTECPVFSVVEIVAVV